MKVAILQSNYIPWKGYFDIINAVDLFVFYDDVQYTTRDWRNRNRIKTPNGTKWLTVPVDGTRSKRICDVNICNDNWQQKHFKSIVMNYSKAKYFKSYISFFEEIYLNNVWEKLSEFNQYFIKRIYTDILKNSGTEFKSSCDFNLSGTKEARLLELLKKCSATEYLSGPSAKSYINEANFLKDGIKVIWMDYNNYPEYSQLYPPFNHFVSIIDLIFNTGPNANKYMKGRSGKL
jgi:6-pyruvoyl-tetrahydropterin synthase